MNLILYQVLPFLSELKSEVHILYRYDYLTYITGVLRVDHIVRSEAYLYLWYECLARPLRLTQTMIYWCESKCGFVRICLICDCFNCTWTVCRKRHNLDMNYIGGSRAYWFVTYAASNTLRWKYNQNLVGKVDQQSNYIS